MERLGGVRSIHSHVASLTVSRFQLFTRNQSCIWLSLQLIPKLVSVVCSPPPSAYLHSPNSQHGFGMIERLGGIKSIQSHVASLTEYLYDRMANLRHSNGKPMLQIFGKHHFSNHREVGLGTGSTVDASADRRAMVVSALATSITNSYVCHRTGMSQAGICRSVASCG